MTVYELIEKLALLPGDLAVVVSRDSEGNGGSPLDEISLTKYEPETSWSGSIVASADVKPGDTLAVVLWPVN